MEIPTTKPALLSRISAVKRELAILDRKTERRRSAQEDWCDAADDGDALAKEVLGHYEQIEDLLVDRIIELKEEHSQLMHAI